MMQQPFIQQTLDDFALDLGKGKGMIGSGSAIAMSSLMGSKLLLSVCKVTLLKGSYSEVHEWVNKQVPLLDSSCDTLSVLMEKDVEAVTTYVKQNRPSVDLLEVPLNISLESVKMLPLAIELYHRGYKIMRGDTATALSLLRAGATAAMFIVKENLKVMADADKYHADVVTLEEEVTVLYRQVDELLNEK